MIRRRCPSARTFVWALASASTGLAGIEACSGPPADSGFPSTAQNGDDSGSQSASDATSGSSSGSGGSSGGSSGSSSGSMGARVDASLADHAAADAMGVVGGDSGGLVGAGDGGTCPAPAGVTSQQQTALQIINQTRAAMSSPCATMVATLNTSATKHCQYYAANVASQSCVADPHVEVSTCTAYDSANFGDRESLAGYKCQPSATQNCQASEVMAFDDDPTAALGQWIGSIYHRSPLLDPRMRDFGYGSATGCDTIDLGEGAGATTAGTTTSAQFDVSFAFTTQ